MLGLQVIDSISGREIDTVESEARQVALSADGSQLYLSGWQGEMPWTEVLDAKSLEVIVHLDGYRLMPARRLDGRPALLGIGESQYQSKLDLIDAKSFEIVYSWALNDYAAWVTAP